MLICLIALNVIIIFLLKSDDGLRATMLEKKYIIFMSKSHYADTVCRTFMSLHENYFFKSYY